MRIFLLAIAAVLALPTAAQASLKVTWPEQRAYVAGETLTVKVVSTKLVRAALVRESASGKIMRTVARRTLRRGTFSATLPAAGRYSLRVAKRARVVSVVPPTPPPPPLVPPPATPAPGSCDRALAATVELRLGATTVRPGESLPYDLVNTSAACVETGTAYSFERQLPDGTWAAAPSNQIFPMVAFRLLPGGHLDGQAQIPADFAPGAYRLLHPAFASNGTIPLAAEFAVVA